MTINQQRVPRILVQLCELNAGIRIRHANRHWKILLNGKFIAIYPFTPRDEGFAQNTKAQLRRNGVILPGDKRNGNRKS